MAHCEVMGHYSELCKNGLTNGDAILIEDLGGPKELCIRWGAAMGGDLVVSLGGTGRRVSAEKIFSPSPPTFEIWGGTKKRSSALHSQHDTHIFVNIIYTNTHTTSTTVPVTKKQGPEKSG